MANLATRTRTGLGRFAAKAKGVASTAITKTTSAGRSLVARERSQADSISGVVDRNKRRMAAALVAGAADNTEIGKSVKDMTGFAAPSDIVFGVGILARGMNLDHGMPTVRQANTDFVEQQLIHYARTVGGKAPSAVGSFLDRRASKGSLPPGKTSGTDQERQPEPASRPTES